LHVRLAIRKSSLRLAATVTSLVLASITAGCQSTKSAAPAATTAAAPAIQLQPYTATDQSASAGVPAGWNVTSGVNTVIQMSGPQGVTVSLGNTVIAKNAAFQLGQRPANGIDLSMPYSATTAQKLTMILQQSGAAAGEPVTQIVINSTTPIQVPATLGQCGRIVASYTDQQGPEKIMAVFCSLALDPGGDYKNIMLLAEAPAAAAAQAAPTAQAIFRSYSIPSTWLQRKLAPQNAAPAMSSATNIAAAAAVMRSTNGAVAGADNSANCFDLSVLRQTPTYQLPRSCGGTKPD
jgi:hypothetical protein